jgi:ABC-type oligopeptide transport system substrate-binding subunit
VSEQLKRVGIDARVEPLPDLEYQQELERGAFAVWLGRWGCSTGDAGELFEQGFHSRDPARRLGVYNVSDYSSPALDEAIEASGDLELPADRKPALQLLMRRVVDETIWIPLYLDRNSFVVARSLAWDPRPDDSVGLSRIHPIGDAQE